MQYYFLMLTLMSVPALAKPMPKQSKESVISERHPHAKKEVHEKKKRRGKRRAPAHSELVQMATMDETPYTVSVEEGTRMPSRARSAEVTPRNHAAVSPYEMKQTKSTMQQPRSASTMIPDSEFTSSPSLDEPDSQFAEESPLSGEVQEVDINPDVKAWMDCELPENMAALKFLINAFPEKDFNSIEGMQMQWYMAEEYNDDEKKQLVEKLLFVKESAIGAFDVSENALWFITYLVPDFVEQVLLDEEDEFDTYYVMAEQINRYISEDSSMETNSLRA